MALFGESKKEWLEGFLESPNGIPSHDTFGDVSSRIDSNTADGSKALQSNSAGFNNAALGYEALRDNSAGTDNTAIGRAALKFNSTGDVNTAVGSLALLGAQGNGNTAEDMPLFRTLRPGATTQV